MRTARTILVFLTLGMLAPVILIVGYNVSAPSIVGGEDWPKSSLSPRSFASRPLPADPIVVPVTATPEPSRASRGTPRVPAPTGVATASARPAPVVRVVRAPTRAAGAGTVWDRLVACESPDRGWRYGAPDVGIDAGYRYMGGPNFTASTWRAYKPADYPENAWDATRAQQITVAKRVLADQGVSAWPRCGPRVGLTPENGLN